MSKRIINMDFVYAIRVLTRRPIYTFVIVVSLSVGIGANTIIYNIYETFFLLRIPKEITNQKRLVWVFNKDNKRNALTTLSYHDYLEYKNNNSVFSDIITYSGTSQRLMWTGDVANIVTEQPVSSNYFDALGIRPIIGRSFMANDEKAAQDCAIISYRLWKTLFDGDLSVIGKSIKLNNIFHVIIGVLPKHFDGFDPTWRVDIYVNFERWLQKSNLPEILLHFEVMALLKPDIKISQAIAEIDVRTKHLNSAHLDSNATIDRGIYIGYVHSGHPNKPQIATLDEIKVLMIIAIIIMILPCINVLSLLLNRVIDRRQELAIRVATGATRLQIVKLLIIESLILNICASVLGVILVVFVDKAFSSLWISDISFSITLFPSLKIMFLSVGICNIIIMIFGLLPIVHVLRDNLALKLSSRESSKSNYLRNIILGGQIAISLAIVIVTTLSLTHQSKYLQQKNQTGNIYLATINWNVYEYSDDKVSHLKSEILKRIESIAGVTNLSVTTLPPYTNSSSLILMVYNSDDVMISPSGIDSSSIGNNYFSTMNIPIIRGRDFHESTMNSINMEIVINRNMAEKYWPNQDVLYKQVKVQSTSFGLINNNTKLYTIVGVVDDHMVVENKPMIYRPLSPESKASTTIIVRHINKNIETLIREEIRNCDPNIYFIGKSLREQLSDFIRMKRIVSFLIFIVGFIIFVVASVGVYGVINYSINSKKREIGIRMMVGANTIDILRVIINQGARIVVFGTGVGIIIACWCAQIIEKTLFDIGSNNAYIYMCIILIHLLIITMACYLPVKKVIKSCPYELMQHK